MASDLLDFPVLTDLKEKVRREQVLGSLSLQGDQLLLPAPMIGSVYCYDKQGTLVKTVGMSGGGYGELAFPIAVSTDIQGNVLVLDKHRHTVVSYDGAGKVNGEFGGMGSGPGWFYHPIFLLADARNRKIGAAIHILGAADGTGPAVNPLVHRKGYFFFFLATFFAVFFAGFFTAFFTILVFTPFSRVRSCVCLTHRESREPLRGTGHPHRHVACVAKSARSHETGTAEGSCTTFSSWRVSSPASLP